MLVAAAAATSPPLLSQQRSLLFASRCFIVIGLFELAILDMLITNYFPSLIFFLVIVKVIHGGCNLTGGLEMSTKFGSHSTVVQRHTSFEKILKNTCHTNLTSKNQGFVKNCKCAQFFFLS